MSARTGGQRRVPWYRRLGLRLTLLIAVTVIGFGRLAPSLSVSLGEWLGVRLDGEFLLGEVVDGEVVPPLFDPLTPETRAFAVELVAHPGDMELTRRLGEDLANTVAPGGIDFLVLSPALDVLAATRTERFAIGVPMAPDPAFEACSQYYPIYDEGLLASWLVLVPPCALDGFVLAEGADDMAVYEGEDGPSEPIPVVSEAEYESSFVRLQLLGTLVGWVLPLLGALGVGLLVSWTVTRRIDRLCRAAREGNVGDPDVFRIGGGDELATLGEELAGSRERVAGLVNALETSDERRREWIAQVSHDLRTPLTALRVCLSRAEPLVASVGDDALREELAETVRVATGDTDRVHTLASDLLEVARIELPGALRRETFPVEELVAQAVTGLRPLAEASNCRLVQEGRTEGTQVHADGPRLLRVMENVLRNAIEHASAEVVVAVARTARGVQVEVLDDGPGFGATGDRRPRPDSAGIGLTVVERLLEAHGARLETGNRAEGGARVAFELASAPA
ncbi:MAG: HAMP domain-containing sensor histidine kinase [Planctomycetota bacterium]